MNEKIGVLGAIGAALLSSACCIGPVVFGGLGIGAIAVAEHFAAYRPLFMAITAMLLGLGYYVAYRKPRKGPCEKEVCGTSRIARWGRPLLWIATVIVLALVTFPYYYGPIRAAFDKPQRPTSAAAQRVQFSTVELKVTRMTCSGCAVSVRNALLETPGVASASVDHEAGRATVQYDSAKASPAQLIEVVKKSGYMATL